jgi:hypothetical protein
MLSAVLNKLHIILHNKQETFQLPYKQANEFLTESKHQYLPYKQI